MASRTTPAERRARFDELCAALEQLLSGPARREIIEALPLDRRDPAAPLRQALRTQRFRTARELIALAPLVEAMDADTGREGFRVLHTWDPAAHRFRADSTPVLLLGYMRPFSQGNVRAEQALLLDTYFLFLLVLLAMRVWDADDPDAALDRVGALLALLQGPEGSGRRQATEVATLIGLAIAQYQPAERGFDELLAKIRTLGTRHQLAIARSNAANFGAHLRWGARFMYDGDMDRMRADNVVDYPWVLHAAATLAHAWEAAPPDARMPLAEGLQQALSADPGAILDDEIPAVLVAHAAERAATAAIVHAHHDALQESFAALAPVPQHFSPFALHFNFLHNVLTASLALTISEGTPNLPLEALLYRGEASPRLAESPAVYAQQLALYAAHPERRGARQAPLIVYDG